MKTPGVHIDELNAFPNSIVPVETAVPAFIGYTPKASYNGKSYHNEPVKITSFQDFQTYFCYPDPEPPAAPAKQYKPFFYVVEETVDSKKRDSVKIDEKWYSILPDPGTIYYLYNSISAFYQNGGGDAYIVSVGTYGSATGKHADQTHHIVNPNVKLNDLLAGLETLKQHKEPTMYICPEATLLSIDDNGTLMERMLQQCNEMQTAVSIFDVIGGNNPDPLLYSEDIQTFRDKTGMNALKYGATYYPFLESTIMSSLDFTNINGGDVDTLRTLLATNDKPNHQVDHTVDLIKKGTLSVEKGNDALMHASEKYKLVLKLVTKAANILPPSGFMAGIYTRVDQNEGVWKAPANETPIAASGLTLQIDDQQQSDLNVDAVTGKSINAIRHFNGLGILVWGARTLDGNSLDWRYINVRRTMTFIEQSCKVATQAYVFEPNNKNTWEAVKAMISSFLTSVWSQGGLQGASASDAFSVAVGLGSTMTSEDILNGIMRVTVKVALTRPDEFIILTYDQQQAVSA